MKKIWNIALVAIAAFSMVWTSCEKNENEPQNETPVVDYTYDEVTNTYTVYTEEGLKVWRKAVGENIETNLTLGADITLSTDGIEVVDGKPSASNWDGGYNFSGTLDGGRYSIKNLRMYDEQFAHFILSCKDATIKNLTFVDPIVYGESVYTGVLTAQVAGGVQIINCHIQGGSVTGVGNGTGGVAGCIGYSKDNFIYGCTNSAKISGSNWVGGIVGSCHETSSISVIAACANTGDVSGEKYVAGITGIHYSNNTDIIACYSTYDTISGAVGKPATECYFVRDHDDTLDGTTAVSDVNTTEVVNAMNGAIDTYNKSATTKIPYKWAVGEAVPQLVAIE